MRDTTSAARQSTARTARATAAARFEPNIAFTAAARARCAVYSAVSVSAVLPVLRRNEEKLSAKPFMSVKTVVIPIFMTHIET